MRCTSREHIYNTSPLLLPCLGMSTAAPADECVVTGVVRALSGCNASLFRHCFDPVREGFLVKNTKYDVQIGGFSTGPKSLCRWSQNTKTRAYIPRNPGFYVSSPPFSRSNSHLTLRRPPWGFEYPKRGIMQRVQTKVTGVRELATCSTTPQNPGPLRFVSTILSVGPAPGPTVD